jgi:site-specific recombinase XerD
VEDCRFHIRAASEVKGPKEETTSHVPALWRADKIRLEQHQVRHLLGSLDRESLDGLRDYTLLLVAFNTGYRVAELRRITLNSISQAGSVYLLSVVGKRNNIDPVPVGAIVVTAIQKWVDTYNEAVGAGDPRQIVGDVPLWQPLRRGGHPLAVGDFNPCAGVSTQAIGDVIGKRSAAALGEKLRMAAHDTRRTFASVLYDAGMPTETIGENLRHSNLATTKLYIGKKPLYESRVATNFVQFG